MLTLQFVSVMEIRWWGDSILGSRSPLILSFIAPSAPTAWHLAGKAPLLRYDFRVQQRRIVSHFSTVALRKAQLPSSIAENSDFDDQPSISRQHNPPSTSTADTLEDIDSSATIDSLLNRTIRDSKSRTARQDSASDVREAFRASRAEVQTRESRQPGDLASMMDIPSAPGTSVSQSDTDRKALQDLQELRQFNLRNKRTIRSRPTVGRTVELDPARGMDFGRALRQLNILCATNKVRADLMRQRFHERPGTKRKRLKSERWRKLFQQSFRATVGRVKEMRRKGW